MSLASQREFLLQQELFTLRDKVDIMNPVSQAPIGHFERKIFSLRTLYRLYGPTDDIELIVQQKLLAARPTFKFFAGNPTGEPEDAGLLGELKRKVLAFKPDYWFEAPDGQRQFEVKGNFLGFKYEVTQDDREIAGISRTFWAIRDTYGLRIGLGVSDQLALLILSSVIVIHAIHEEERHRSR